MRALSLQEFTKTPAGMHAKRELQHMVTSSEYKTNIRRDPQISYASAFVERHMSYLAKHPFISPAAYLSNLRVMTRASH